jgi:NodT family efflux transporter outer membrane factor (OMF) lipoprotein
MKAMNARRVLPALTSVLLAGCNLAPAYHPPATVPVPASFKEAPGWGVAAPADALAKGEWWTLFEDPVLDALVAKVEVTNQTVAQYRAAYQAARALTSEERAALFPQITGTASATHNGGTSSGGSVISSGGSTAVSSSKSNFTLGIGASWEPDLWGALGNAVHQAHASEEASAGDLANATLSARGELAADYLQLRGIDAQLALLTDTVTAYDRALTITRNKYAAGTVARSDVEEAQTSLSNAQADQRDYQRQRAVLEHAIAVLVGENPSTFAIAPVAWHPVVPAIPGVVPSTLLERRPDVAAAERRVAAANANIGIQRAAFFPQLGLSASGSLGAGSLANLFSSPLTFWSLGASVAQSVFDFGANAAKLRQAHAQFDEVAATYRQTVLTAFQQTEDNLAGVSAYGDEAKLRETAAAAATRAEQIARNQYVAGTVDYSQVIVAQTAAYTARESRIQAVVNQQTTAVALVQAIGGSWALAPGSPTAPPSAAPPSATSPSAANP